MKVNKNFYNILIKSVFESLETNKGLIVDIKLPKSVESQLLEVYKETTHKAKNIRVSDYGVLIKSLQYFMISGMHDMGSGPIYINIQTLEITTWI